MSFWFKMVLTFTLFSVAAAHAEITCASASDKALDTRGRADLEGKADLIRCKTGLMTGRMNTNDCIRIISRTTDTAIKEIDKLYKENCKSGDIITLPSNVAPLIRQYCNFDKAIVPSGDRTVCVVRDGIGTESEPRADGSDNGAASPKAAEGSTPPFNEGRSNRESFQNWIRGLDGSTRTGAEWWAANRSRASKLHLECASVSLSDSFLKGCSEAKSRLTEFDRRRLAEPDYRAGWNSVINANGARP